MKAFFKFLAARPKVVASVVALLLALLGVGTGVVDPGKVTDAILSFVTEQAEEPAPQPEAVDAGL